MKLVDIYPHAMLLITLRVKKTERVTSWIDK